MAAGAIAVEVVFAHRGRVWQETVSLPEGACVGDALEAAAEVGAALERECPGLLRDPAALAVYGEAVTRSRTLEPGDRVEIVGPLQVDPKDARRRRAAGR